MSEPLNCLSNHEARILVCTDLCASVNRIPEACMFQQISPDYFYSYSAICLCIHVSLRVFAHSNGLNTHSA